MATEFHNPLEQFEIHQLIPIQFGNFDISFTNSSAFMVAIVLFIWGFVAFGMRKGAAVPGRWQSTVEIVYEFIGGMLYETVGPEARKFFPFIFTLFTFVLIANLLGMVPYTFTVTSHIVVTFAFAFLVFIGVIIMGFYNHGFRFLKIFAPSGVPWFMYIILIPIEIISFLSRPISLSVRLFANMMAGHTMLKVIASFVALLGIWGIFPILFIVALTGLEILIAFLQAYVFAMLSCIYLNDAYHIEH